MTEKPKRNGKLKINASFDEALRAALQVKPPRPAKKRKAPKDD